MYMSNYICVDLNIYHTVKHLRAAPNGDQSMVTHGSGFKHVPSEGTRGFTKPLLPSPARLAAALGAVPGGEPFPAFAGEAAPSERLPMGSHRLPSIESGSKCIPSEGKRSETGKATTTAYPWEGWRRPWWLTLYLS